MYFVIPSAQNRQCKGEKIKKKYNLVKCFEVPVYKKRNLRKPLKSCWKIREGVLTDLERDLERRRDLDLRRERRLRERDRERERLRRRPFPSIPNTGTDEG